MLDCKTNTNLSFLIHSSVDVYIEKIKISFIVETKIFNNEINDVQLLINIPKEPDLGIYLVPSWLFDRVYP